MTPIPDPSALEFIGNILSFVFPFWPFILIINGLRGRGKPKLENIIHNTLLFWVLLLIIRGVIFVSGVELFSVINLIPEPLSTILFFITGIILVIIQSVLKNKSGLKL